MSSQHKFKIIGVFVLTVTMAVSMAACDSGSSGNGNGNGLINFEESDVLEYAENDTDIYFEYPEGWEMEIDDNETIITDEEVTESEWFEGKIEDASHLFLLVNAEADKGYYERVKDREDEVDNFEDFFEFEVDKIENYIEEGVEEGYVENFERTTYGVGGKEAVKFTGEVETNDIPQSYLENSKGELVYIKDEDEENIHMGLYESDDYSESLSNEFFNSVEFQE